MTKNLKYSFILFAVFFGIVIAWNTLASFFNGVGINFVALLVVLSLIVMLFITDSFVAKRTRELLIACCVFAALEFLIYFIFEFGIGSLKTFKVFTVFQNIFSFVGILMAGYLAFRFICEIKGVKFGFVEMLLGNEKRVPKQKKAKELSNGSLEDKPNHSNFETTEPQHSNDNIIVEEENMEE